MNQYIQEEGGEFDKAIDFFKKDIAALRTGRVNPGILDGVQVEAYGVKTPINGLASITVPDGKSLVVSPWDKNVIKDVEKAITVSDLGFGIVNEGDKIRLTMPPMTEENRKDLVKKLNEKMEAVRIAVRRVREDIKAAIELAEESKEIAEDEKFRFIKELDEEIGKRNNEIKGVRDSKEGEIMTI